MAKKDIEPTMAEAIEETRLHLDSFLPFAPAVHVPAVAKKAEGKAEHAPRKYACLTAEQFVGMLAKSLAEAARDLSTEAAPVSTADLLIADPNAMTGWRGARGKLGLVTKADLEARVYKIHYVRFDLPANAPRFVLPQ